MHFTVKKTLETIIKTNNNYIVCIKKNRRYLYDEVEKLCSKWKSKKAYFKTKEKSRNRHEIRKLYVYQASSKIQRDWPGAMEVVKVIRHRRIGDIEESHTHYYLSSRRESARYYMQSIRGHWKIENCLHWVKDVVMKDDALRIKKPKVVTIMSMFSTICLNIFRSKKRSDCKNFMVECADNIELLAHLIE